MISAYGCVSAVTGVGEGDPQPLGDSWISFHLKRWTRSSLVYLWDEGYWHPGAWGPALARKESSPLLPTGAVALCHPYLPRLSTETHVLTH